MQAECWEKKIFALYLCMICAFSHSLICLIPHVLGLTQFFINSNSFILSIPSENIYLDPATPNDYLGVPAISPVCIPLLNTLSDSSLMPLAGEFTWGRWMNLLVMGSAPL